MTSIEGIQMRERNGVCCMARATQKIKLNIELNRQHEYEQNTHEVKKKILCKMRERERAKDTMMFQSHKRELLIFTNVISSIEEKKTESSTNILM